MPARARATSAPHGRFHFLAHDDHDRFVPLPPSLTPQDSQFTRLTVCGLSLYRNNHNVRIDVATLLISLISYLPDILQMKLTTYRTPSGYLLPSIHSAPPFFTLQPNTATQTIFTENWTRLILSYARYRNMFILRVEDAEVLGSDWDEILRNERIKRKILPSHLSFIMEDMVRKNLAAYDPPKQTKSVLLYWRSLDEWAEVLYDWDFGDFQANSIGQLNTIMTFYEIIEPAVPSPLSGIPMTILRKAITILTKTNRAQIIAIADGEGVRFLPGSASR
ncbi:hypothetical protein NM688_g2282 [Phlebia brevispora]|uniref:Uncharacterized protein n=1 Tax=Phlebia brevispora TaxID=194682 RepID=A0ACC1T9Q6_9APHY|nr:hypothetical protein NM688_g2282 [Phlebia brevispora]